jgi:uncharacterized membrane protein YgdD (TMEM256/DUF423 family)
MHQKNLLLPSFLFLTAILLGALGAHALKDHLSAEKLQSFETGVRYQVYGALGLFVQLFAEKLYGISLQLSRRLGLLGTCFFSGSVYGLTLLPLAGAAPSSIRLLGPVTPLGGVLLMLSWGFFMYLLLKKNTDR